MRKNTKPPASFKRIFGAFANNNRVILSIYRLAKNFLIA
jgi:hypothetical protein